MSSDNQRLRIVGGITGKGFEKGKSANPGGRPRGIAKRTRELVGDDGERLVKLWIAIAEDEDEKTADRIRASELLADRGWGKAPAFALVEDDDPLGLTAEEASDIGATFRTEVLRLAAAEEAGDAASDAGTTGEALS